MDSTLKRALSIVLALSAVGCWQSESVEILENSPRVKFCFFDQEDSENESVGPDTSIELIVLEPCFPANRELVDAGCTVDVVDNKINVTSAFEYLHLSDFAPAVCRVGYARCEATSLDGQYTLVHGDVERSVAFPSDSNLDCNSVRKPYGDALTGEFIDPVTGEITDMGE